jgi:hypothetical protein
LTHPIIFYFLSYQGFYVVPGPHTHLDTTPTHMAPPGPKPEYDDLTLKPLYGSPATIRGHTQLVPRSRFLSNGIAILNFRLDSFRLDTSDLGKILGPFATGFFPEEENISLIFEDIVYDLARSQRKHKQKIHSVVEKLRAARSVPRAGTPVDSHLSDVVLAPLSRP